MNQNKPLENIDNIETDPFKRNMTVAGLGVKAGAQFAAHQLGQLFSSKNDREARDRRFYQQQATQLADALGKLKGSMMKVGQMLSLYAQYFMPSEVVEVLTNLQDHTPALAWARIEPQLRTELGDKYGDFLIDQNPLAAASLGQVHRAIHIATQTEVCLKIQYPGVADAIKSDVQSLSRLVSMLRLMPKDLNVDAVFAEVENMLYQEVDYAHELKQTEDYFARYGADSRYVVPRPLSEYCTNKLLVLTYESSNHVQDLCVQNLSQIQRDYLAKSALDLFLDEFFVWNRVQTDPHFGNYRVRLDANNGMPKLVMLDFGATRVFDPIFVNNYRALMHAALQRDRFSVIDASSKINLMEHSFPDSILDAFVQVCFLIVEPFANPYEHNIAPELLNSQGAYRWGMTDLPTRVSKTIAKAALSRYFKVPPSEIVFLHRRLAGVFILLATLNAELNARVMLLPHLRG